jgi:hypothetical protein
MVGSLDFFNQEFDSFFNLFGGSSDKANWL